MPPFTSGSPGSREDEKPGDRNGGGGGGGEGGDDGTPLDPVIKSLVNKLPKAGSIWSERDRDLWLELLKGSFKLIYLDEPEEKRDDDPPFRRRV